jgi:hypothetical protein
MSEPILDDEEVEENSKKTDFVKLGGNFLTSINYKIAFFLFLIGMVIFSDIFIDGVLSKFDGSVSGECTTTKGTMIQLLLLCLGYIIIDLLVRLNWI